MRPTDPTNRVHAVRASRSRSLITDALRDPSPEVVRAALERLVELEGPRGADVLRGHLLTADLALVTDFAAALRGLGDAATVDVAIGALTDQLYTRRLAAALALGALPDPRARAPLRVALDDEIAAVRAAAVDALAKLEPEDDTVGDCRRLLGDPSAQVRIAAIRTTVRLAPGAANALSPLAEDPDCLVRLEVARHVAGLSAEAAARLLADGDAGVRREAALAAGPAQALALARLLAGDPSGEVRRAVARSLGSLDPGVVADGLVCGIEDPDAIVRAAVLHALERSLTRAVAAARLSRELASPRPQRRRWSVYALARLHARKAAADVWRLADDPEPDVRFALIQSAPVLLPEPEPLLLYMATDPDGAVRDGARNRLKRWRGARGDDDLGRAQV